MAILSDPDRFDVRKQFCDSLNQTREACNTAKTDIQAAVNGLDDYLNANAAAINAAIPQPARGALTVAQKARLLQYVIEKRYLRGA